MRATLCLLITGLVWAAAPDPGSAAEITSIQYDLGQSSLSVTGSGQNLPVTGTLTLNLESSGATPIVSGDVGLQTMLFYATGIDVGFGVLDYGVFLTQPSTGGHLDTAHHVTGLAATSGVLAVGTIHCTQMCGTHLLIFSVPITYISGIALPLSQIQFTGSSLGGLSATAPFNHGGTFYLVGTEISRSTVPEPAPLSLIALAALALLAPAAWRIRGRRA